MHDRNTGSNGVANSKYTFQLCYTEQRAVEVTATVRTDMEPNELESMIREDRAFIVKTEIVGKDFTTVLAEMDISKQEELDYDYDSASVDFEWDTRDRTDGRD